MAVSKGGTSNNQNQNQFGAYTGQGSTSQNAAGTTNQSTTGTQTGSTVGSTSQVSTPVAPVGWETAWQGMQPGQNGFSSTQQPGVDWLGGALQNPDPANLAAPRAGMQWGANYFQDQAANRTAPTLANLAASGNAAYATPADVQAQQIAAQQGAKFMGDYQNPYLKDVLDTSLTDYDVGTDRAANAFRVGNIAGGASGAGSNPVGAAIFAGEANRGRGALSSGIRSNAFNTAAGFGMQDAGRFLAADQANQQANLAASTFNNQQAQARNMFDANLGMQYNDQRDRTVRDLVNTQGNIANVGTTGFGIGQGLAQGVIGAGAQGQGQNLNWLNAGTPLFGQSNTGTVNQNTMGTQNQDMTGMTNQNTTGTSNESGSTSGNSSGSARGKSGGITGGA
jgi:hypothetical protein